MCAITIDSETVQHRRSDCRRKISIRSASDLSFSQLIVERSSYTTRVLVKRHHSVGAFQWRAIDSAAHHKPHPIVNRAESQYLTLNSGAFLDSTGNLRSTRPRAPAATTFETVPPSTTPTFTLIPVAGLFIACSRSIRRPISKIALAPFPAPGSHMSRSPPSFDNKHASSLARSLNASAARWWLKNQHCSCASGFCFDDSASALAPSLLVTSEQQDHRTLRRQIQ